MGQLTPVVVSAGLEEQHPELAVLAALEATPILISTGVFSDDVVTLLNLWPDVIRVLFLGPEQEGIRFAMVSERAGIAARVVIPGAKLLLQILSQAAGLEEAVMEAKTGFPQFIKDVQAIAGQA